MSSYSEITNGTPSDTTQILLKDRDAAVSQRQVLYQLLRTRQEHWYLDLELIAETHSDNAYAGTTGAEVVPFENNNVDASNPNLERDWNRYLEDIAQSNVLINGLDYLQKKNEHEFVHDSTRRLLVTESFIMCLFCIYTHTRCVLLLPILEMHV